MAADHSLARRAFGKINLELRVLGVRPDGHHELRTIFQAIALADALTFTRAPGPFRIVCDDPRCPTDRRNLVWRAAELVWKAAGRRGAPRDTIVTIAKRIPIQAGLGGGSSDAAAALLALASFWRVKLSATRLHELAAAIGADVPYFLEGGAMLGRDRGDRLSRVTRMPRAWVVVVVPRFGVSTKEAFAWWDRDHRVGRVRRGEPVGPGAITNDLQPVVARRHRVVTTIVASLERAGAFQASLSGSGSAIFGLFKSWSAAGRAVLVLRRRNPRRFVLLTRTLDRRECRKLAANWGHRIDLGFAPRSASHA
jgi:4-diphosphocytidyl-2-C-methyl-D-erythritol kinase